MSDVFDEWSLANLEALLVKVKNIENLIKDPSIVFCGIEIQHAYRKQDGQLGVAFKTCLDTPDSAAVRKLLQLQLQKVKSQARNLHAKMKNSIADLAQHREELLADTVHEHKWLEEPDPEAPARKIRVKE